ncbi:MAG: hypothetical protein HQK65_01680, partial [Desulfamplus sp.]|nr:hypothetical protein [Desulfamplus sp.]
MSISTNLNHKGRYYPAQHILKTTIDGSFMPYSPDELIDEFDCLCAEKENDANKVARCVAKSAAAILLSSRRGDEYEAICTGAAAGKGALIRIFDPPVEGRLVSGYEGVDVGKRLRVQLINTDVDNGYIDFKNIVSSDIHIAPVNQVLDPASV